MKKTIGIFISLCFVVVAVTVANYIKNMNTSEAASDTVKRSELENAVVATALQYLYKNKYSDYEQKQMDGGVDYVNVYDKDGKITRVKPSSDAKAQNTYSVTYPFRTFNTNVEGVSRTNQFFIDCSSFSMSVYLNTFGFDFSSLLDSKEFKDQNISFVSNYDNQTRLTINTKARYQNSYKDGNTRVLNTAILDNARKGVNNNAPVSNTTYSLKKNSSVIKNKFVVYYRELKGSEITYTNESKIYGEMKDILKPGDLIVRRKGASDPENGHVVVYVGNKLKITSVKTKKDGAITNYTQPANAIIEAKGNDLSRTYSFANKNSTSGRAKDNFSIRYTEDFDYMIFDSDGVTSMKYLILRPLNEFCGTGDTCTLPTSHTYYGNVKQKYNDVSKFRIGFHDFVAEQYITDSDGKTIGNYNRIKPAMPIKVKLSMKKPNNVGNFGYCATTTTKKINEPGVQAYVEDSIDELEQKATGESTGKDNEVVDKDVNNTATLLSQSCLNKGYTWKGLKSNLSSSSTGNVTVTAAIPSWADFSRCTDSCKKTKDKNGKVISLTWENLPFSKTETVRYIIYVPTTYGERSIPGFKVTKADGNKLSLPDMKVTVAPVVRGATAQKNFSDSVNKFKDWVDDFQALQKFWNNNITVSKNPLVYFNKINGSNYDYDLRYSNASIAPGMYGGQLFRGNDAKDNDTTGKQKGVQRIKYLTEADFEVGDVLLTYDLKNNSKVSSPEFNPKAYMYYGHGKFIRFSTEKYIYHNQDLNSEGQLKVTKYVNYSSDATAIENYKKGGGWGANDYFIRSLYNTDLFVVLRVNY